MNTVRLLLVDQHDDFLDGLSAWLDEFTGFRVVGIAHSGQEAIDKMGRLSPDLVLMDISLPDMTGLAATRRIKAQPGAPPVVLMTLFASGAVIAEAQAAGADGCLSKPELTESLIDVIESLMQRPLKRMTRPQGIRPAEPSGRRTPKEAGD